MAKSRLDRSMAVQFDASPLYQPFSFGLYGDIRTSRKQKVPGVHVGVAWTNSSLVIHPYSFY
jgi:hypothetical protein